MRLNTPFDELEDVKFTTEGPKVFGMSDAASPVSAASALPHAYSLRAVRQYTVYLMLPFIWPFVLWDS